MGAQDVVSGIKDLFNNGGGEINTASSIQALSTMETVLSSILGLAIVILAIGIPLIIALEVCYINIPFFRSTADKLAETADILERPVGLMFRDARKAIEQANTVKTGRSANAEYIRIKIVTIFIAFTVIALCFGPINVIIRIIAGVVIDIIQALF